jgi:uncharacterized DUF497 family protein
MKPVFEWDPERAKKNTSKHQVTFGEACSVFNDPMFITLLDEEHTKD